MNAEAPSPSLPARLRLHRAVHGLMLGLALAGLLALAARPHLGPDTWWHLRTGAWIWEHRRLPTTDPFSYTRYGTAWQPPGWPVQLLFYGLVRWAGYGALNVWTAFMVVLTYLLVARALRGEPYTRALALVLAGLTGSLYQAARPYMITSLLTALYLWALETWYRGSSPRRLKLLPLAMTFWVNTHAGFLAGFLVWGSYLVGAGWESLTERRASDDTMGASLSATPSSIAKKRVTTLLRLGPWLLLATLLNPQGAKIWSYPFQTLSLQHLTWIAEWQSPDFTQPYAWPFLLWWALLLLIVGPGMPPWRAHHLLLWLLFGFMGFRAVRNIALFALVAPIVWTAYAPARLSQWRKRLRYYSPLRPRIRRLLATREPPPPRPWVNRALVALAWLLALTRLVVHSTPQAMAAYVAETFPQSAVAYMKTMRPPGRLFNDYNWGGYLLWTLPEYPVFIDGRTDLYGDTLLQTWGDIVNAEPGWQEHLQRYQVHTVLLPRQRPLTRVLPLSGWKEVYRDDQAVLFVRP